MKQFLHSTCKNCGPVGTSISFYQYGTRLALRTVQTAARTTLSCLHGVSPRKPLT
jgi:hypothetical protein